MQLLTLLSLLPFAYSSVKMIEFYGKITTTNAFTLQAPNGIQYCNKSAICVASECPPTAPRCFIHTLQEDDELKLSLSEATSGGNNIVAIKAILSDDTCPPDYKNIAFKMTSSEGELLSWKKVSGIWRFETCKKNWKRFERSSGKIVFMRGIKLSVGVLKEQARSECAGLGGALTGVASVEESQWMRDKVTDLTNSINNNTFWLEGERLNTCDLEASWGYKTNLKWEDGIMESKENAMTEENCDISCVSNEGEDERCWGIMSKMKGRTATIANVACGGSSTMQGAFCAYELYKEYQSFGG